MTFMTSQSAEATYTPTESLAERLLRDELLTVVEVAQLLKVPVSWVYERTRRRNRDRMPHFKLGKYLRFSAYEVMTWLERIRRN
jgi:excisionase family DNA binding protein